MLLISHRGCTSHGPENSWSAFEQAIQIGCHRIEMDLQLTADNEIIIMHDDSLDRTTNIKEKVSKLTLREIRNIKLTNGESIPEFTEIIDKYLSVIEINAEIKENGETIAKRAGSLLAKHPLRHKIIFSSFYRKPLITLKNYFPELKRAVLWGPDTIKINPYFYFFPEKFLLSCDSKIFHPQADKISKRIMKKMKFENFQVFPWVPMDGEDQNAEELWDKLYKLEIDGLCTNKPVQLQKWLTQKSIK